MVLSMTPIDFLVKNCKKPKIFFGTAYLLVAYKINGRVRKGSVHVATRCCIIFFNNIGDLMDKHRSFPLSTLRVTLW